MEKKILIGETKLNKSKISLKTLRVRAEPLLKEFPNYTPTFLPLSIEDATSPF